MAVEETTQGWYQPVFQAMASPTALLWYGVPQGLVVTNALVTTALALIWWQACLVAILVHGIAMIGTAWEPQWWALLGRYLRYRGSYEG